MSSDDSDFSESFVVAVGNALLLNGIDCAAVGKNHGSIGAAVSGGADSTALLISLAELCRRNAVALHVITINHNMRPESQTKGDMLFVQERCDLLARSGFPVDCTAVEIERGAVSAAARERKCGDEEAARFLRYREFESFAANSGVSCLCLAHNRNDQLETLLMRFLQGSGGDAAAGIKSRRGIFVRPLLGVPRSDIERYLNGQNIPWRTDATNSDTRYLRNRIRHRLMPLLDELYPGWGEAVLAGARKSVDREAVVAAAAEQCHWTRTGTYSVSLPVSVFTVQQRAVRVHLLYDACTLCGISNRVPYSFVEEAADGTGGSAAGCEIGFTESAIFVKKAEKGATDFGFFSIIERSGVYEIPCGTLTVQPAASDSAEYQFSITGQVALQTLPVAVALPVCLRSRQCGDEIATAAGTFRAVADIFASWKVTAEDRDKIPIVQDLTDAGQPIRALWGAACGYENWVVKQRTRREDL